MYVVLVCPPPGLKQYYKLVQSHPLPHKIFEEKVQHLLELFSKIPFNQALVFSNLHTRYFNVYPWPHRFLLIYLFITKKNTSHSLDLKIDDVSLRKRCWFAPTGLSTWQTSCPPKVYLLFVSQVRRRGFL